MRRKIGYVIQDNGLLPHLNVFQNISLVGKISNIDISIDRIHELLDLVGLDRSLTEKKPSHLSGGQQQRVGIARALATNPDIILMDEPFSALDNITRTQLQEDFSQLKSLDAKTIILVTHDVQEAFKLADRIALIDNGQIQQYGSPLELLNDPSNETVSKFLAKDHFILSLQSEKFNGTPLLSLLNNESLSTKEKMKAMSHFLENTPR